MGGGCRVFHAEGSQTSSLTIPSPPHLFTPGPKAVMWDAQQRGYCREQVLLFTPVLLLPGHDEISSVEKGPLQ